MKVVLGKITMKALTIQNPLFGSTRGSGPGAADRLGGGERHVGERQRRIFRDAHWDRALRGYLHLSRKRLRLRLCGVLGKMTMTWYESGTQLRPAVLARNSTESGSKKVCSSRLNLVRFRSTSYRSQLLEMASGALHEANPRPSRESIPLNAGTHHEHYC